MAALTTWWKLQTPEDAKIFIKTSVENGADYIKLMHESGSSMGVEFAKPTLELQAAVIKEAHAAGKVAVAHALALNDHLEILGLGVDGLTHTFYDQPPTRELIQAYKKNNAWLNPTLAAIGSLTAEGKTLAERFAHDPRVEGKVDGLDLERLCRCMNFRKESSKVEYAYESVRQLKKAGIDIIW